MIKLTINITRAGSSLLLLANGVTTSNTHNKPCTLPWQPQTESIVIIDHYGALFIAFLCHTFVPYFDVLHRSRKEGVVVSIGQFNQLRKRMHWHWNSLCLLQYVVDIECIDIFLIYHNKYLFKVCTLELLILFKIFEKSSVRSVCGIEWEQSYIWVHWRALFTLRVQFVLVKRVEEIVKQSNSL